MENSKEEKRNQVRLINDRSRAREIVKVKVEKASLTDW